MMEIKSCEVCGSNDLTPVLDLGCHPLCDDLVPIGDTRVCREYPIEILFCKKCATAHQRFQIPKHELFPRSYHYRSRFTKDVLNGMSALVDACEMRVPTLRNKIVLDIGCNDGSLLDFFHSKGCTTIGIEPTSACTDAKKSDHTIYDTYLSKELAAKILKKHGHPDIITFTNVFAHIENLPAVIESLKLLCSPETMIVIENHYLGAVFDRNQFDTFYHEHTRTYSYTSFIHIAASIGKQLNHVEFPSRYGGNIRVFLGGPSHLHDSINSNQVLKSEENFYEQFKQMHANIKKWKLHKNIIIQNLTRNENKLIGKAFPGRAAILIKMLGINENSISAVFEKPGSMKIGNYIPGTRIPILSDDELFAKAVKPAEILNLAWHISPEIKAYLNDMGFTGSVIDILAAEDWRVPA